MQDPIEVKVGRSCYVSRQSGSKRRKILTRGTFYYVPLLSTLKQILKIQPVRHEILRSAKHSDNLLHDLSDGYLFKEHSFFKGNPSSLQIVAYYDEVETCNPLGSSSGKFKLGCVFFTLGNIRPMYRSGLKAIFLLIVAKSPVIKVNGLDSILKPFLNDLKTLYEDGITIQFDGKSEVWRGALLAFLADNLAAHELGGFKESFSFSRHFCRSCLTDKECSQKHFRENLFVVRTPDSHRAQCKLLNGPDRLKVSIEYGINRCPALDSVSDFSVVKNMPHDIMHDLFEGVIPYEMKLLIQHLIRKSYIQLDILNHRLVAFDFGYSELGDKPAPIVDDSRLRQTASQMWLLARVLPLLVGDLVPREDLNWKCFLKLLKICELCTAPVLSEDSAAYLELLIEEHHSQFKSLYKDISIIPKMHFMIHFPQQILDYGPLIHTWTMRHEAKLRIIKRAARVSNFKNVCQTVAKRHQHLLSFYIHSNMLLTKPVITGPCKPHSTTAYPENVQLLFKEEHQLVQESIVFTSSFVSYNGITFKPNAFVLFKFDVLEPVFCKISMVIKTESDEIILVLNEFVTEYCDDHYHAFCITEHDIPHVCNIKNLSHSNYIFHLRQSFAKDGKLYITFKYIEI